MRGERAGRCVMCGDVVVLALEMVRSRKCERRLPVTDM